jgi:hypothetical protein
MSAMLATPEVRSVLINQKYTPAGRESASPLCQYSTWVPLNIDVFGWPAFRISAARRDLLGT